MSSYWISCPDVITRETKHHEVDHSIYVYIRQLEHALEKLKGAKRDDGAKPMKNSGFGEEMNHD